MLLDSGKPAAGKVVIITVNFSAAVTVTGGTPTLLLNDGGSAKYTGGSGKTALSFSYTVAVGQVTPDLAITGFALNGAVIQNGISNPAILDGAIINPPGILLIDAPLPPTNLLQLVDSTIKVTLTAVVGGASRPVPATTPSTSARRRQQRPRRRHRVQFPGRWHRQRSVLHRRSQPDQSGLEYHRRFPRWRYRNDLGP
jgi:hypothetical protein